MAAPSNCIIFLQEVIPSAAERRYDFVFAKKDMLVKEAQYLYDEAIKATSDHAMVLVDFDK